MARGERRGPASTGEPQYKHPIPSREDILALMERAGEPLRLEALGAEADIHGDQHLRALENRLKAMVRDGQLIRNRAREYLLTGHLDLVTGKVQAHRDGFGFLIPDDGDDDVYMPANEMRTLWDGDRIAVRVTPSKRGGREGHLVEVLARAKSLIVGQLRRERGIDYVLEEGAARTEVLIARGEGGGAKPGDIVQVEVLEYPSRQAHAVGRVVQCIGTVDQPGVETDVAILAHGIPAQWPEEVVEAAAAVPAMVPDSSKAGREDLRDLPLVTIDGADARDFDDAVYCEPRKDGWRLIVAIADVSHYVEVESALDREARVRGTSVYFPDRVVPMLPEALSNGLCSLNPDVDRLCMVCDMRVSTKGEVTRSTFYEGVMRSAARLTYVESAELLEGKHARGKHARRLTELRNLRNVYEAFEGARKRRGAIDFDLPQTKIALDEQGKVARINAAERLITHKIIEECMIAANVQAAKHIRKAKLPSLYRVHEGPNEEKVEELSLFLKTLGMKLPPAGKLMPLHLSKLVDSMHGRPEASLIDSMLLRLMSQARYQPKNVGHFGLALDSYAHFTSPIRRYPDLLVHRTIKWSIEHRSGKGFPYTMPAMEHLGELTSRAERRADEAVWDVEEQLKCIYMSDRVGQQFDVLVASVVPFGLFVRVPELQIDGLVHVSSLPGDYYHRDETGALRGERTGTTYRLADPLKVTLQGVNLDERKIDFQLANKPAANAPSPAAPPRRRRKRRG
jgi:ribonuclease R